MAAGSENPSDSAAPAMGSGRRRSFSLDRAFADIGGALLVLMMLGTVISSLGRFSIGVAIPDFESIAAMALIGVVFLPMAYAQATRANVEVTVFTDWLGVEPRVWLFRFGCFVGLFAVAILAFAMLQGALRSYATGDLVQGVMRIPTWPARWVAVVGVALLIFRLLLDLISSRRVVESDFSNVGGAE